MIDEIWECSFEVGSVLLKPEWGEDKIELHGIISLAQRTDERGIFINGKITILSNKLSRPHEIQRKARERLYLLYGLSEKSIGSGLGHIERVPSITIKSVDLINADEIKKAGQSTFADLRYHEATIAAISVICEEDMRQFLPGYDKVLAKAPSLSMAIRWFVRAVSSNNLVDRFVGSWITFNMIYDCETGARNHVKGTKGLIGKGVIKPKQLDEIVTEHNKLLQELSRQAYIDIHRINRAEKLSRALTNGKPADIVVGAIDALGFLRHNIFHGNLSENMTSDAGLYYPFIKGLNKKLILTLLNK